LITAAAILLTLLLLSPCLQRLLFIPEAEEAEGGDFILVIVFLIAEMEAATGEEGLEGAAALDEGRLLSSCLHLLTPEEAAARGVARGAAAATVAGLEGAAVAEGRRRSSCLHLETEAVA